MTNPTRAIIGAAEAGMENFPNLPESVVHPTCTAPIQARAAAPVLARTSRRPCSDEMRWHDHDPPLTALARWWRGTRQEADDQHFEHVAQGLGEVQAHRRQCWIGFVGCQHGGRWLGVWP